MSSTDRERPLRAQLRRPTELMLLIVGLAICTAGYGQYRVVHLEKPYNTPGSETGGLITGDTVFVYSSLQQQPTKNRHFRFAGSQMQLYQARIAKSGKVGRPRLCRWGFNNKRQHTGNLCFDPYNHDAYFTRCDIDDENLNCEIYYARKRKRGWEKPERLKGEVNLKGYTATHPAAGRLGDSTTVLYFVSDRPGGCGGLDIWYSIVKNGTASEPVNLGPQINSEADDITPFYDQRNGVLYFSSDRAGGIGGHDIYCAEGSRNTWGSAQPVCRCLNSEQNDIYFTITDYDEATGAPASGYLSSNRPDSYFLVDSTCCNDLYQWGMDSAAIRIPEADTIAADTIRLLVRRFMFPLFLYFHNDEPDPRSREAVTEMSYEECQQRYAALRKDYIGQQRNADDSALVAEFFDSCVVGNYHRVEQLFDYIESLLDEGNQITITISGYASPVFTGEYNQLLSRRRIGSFINMVRAWHNGVFEEALNTGSLFVRQEPHGAVEPTTESQSADPVYGLPAALARRIEILGCEIR